MSEVAKCSGCVYNGKNVYEPEHRGKLDLLVVTAYPNGVACQTGKPSCKNLAPVKSFVVKNTSTLRVGYQFALGCSPFDPDTKGFKRPKVEEINRCKPRLIDYVKRTEPRVILLSGVDACKPFGIKGIMKDLRGTIHDVNVDGHNAKAVVTYCVNKVYNEPGYYPVLIRDLDKATRLCSGEFENPELDIETPVAYDHVIAALDRAQRVVDDKVAACGNKTVVAVDTETTSLDPRKPGGKVIAISVSVENGHGLSFLVDHRDAQYTNGQKITVLEKFLELVNPEKVVTCAANAKFDYKWLAFTYGLPMKYFDYDILLGEHVLEEDKKGEYDLKKLTLDYFPAIGGYEDALGAELERIQGQYGENRKAEVDRVFEGLINWWVSMDDEERVKYVDDWIEKAYIALEMKESISTVKFVNKGGQRVVSKKYKSRLKSVLEKIPPHELNVELPGPREVTYEDVPVMTMLHYAALDALVTRFIFARQYWGMQEEMQNIRVAGVKSSKTLWYGYEAHTMPLSEKLAEMEYAGVRFDRQRAGTYIDKIDTKLEEHKPVLFSEAGEEFKLSSSAPDVARILFSKMKYESEKKTDKGFQCTNEEVIRALYETHKTRFLKSLLVHRKLESARSKLLGWIKGSGHDGKIHFSIHQNATATHRLSSSNPPLQNIMHYVEEADLNIKALFLPDSDEFELYDLDISNAEMRVLAAYANDDNLTDTFLSGKDIHSMTASVVSKYDYDDIVANKENKQSDQYKMRQLGKKINFATVYGQGAKSLSKDFGAILGRVVTEEEAEKYLDGFFRTYPGIEKYTETTKNCAKRYGFAYTKLGRRRCFPMAAHDRGKLHGAFRQAVNFRIQSTAADIVNANLVDLADRIKPLGGRVVLTVHDSILFQLPRETAGVKDLLDEVILEGTKERFPWLPVPWKYDVGKGDNYGECVDPVV